MDKLIEHWKTSYYTDLLLSISLISVFIISLTKRKKYPQFKFFPFYFASFIVLQFKVYLSAILSVDNPYRLKILSPMGNYIDYFVTLAEFIAFIYFFYCIIRNNKKRKLIKWLTGMGLSIALFILLKDIFYNGSFWYSSLTNVYIVESLILLVPCFFYYRELFTFPPKLNLLHEANFWTVTGLTFYLLCTFPITFISFYLAKTNYSIYAQTFSIIYLFYILLFLMIIKSYLCKPTNLI